jgi:hypothetical protein
MKSQRQERDGNAKEGQQPQRQGRKIAKEYKIGSSVQPAISVLRFLWTGKNDMHRQCDA